MKTLFQASLACVLGVMTSCSATDSKDKTPDATKIGKDGGTVAAADVSASVEVPAGALPTATTIEVTESDVDVAAPSGYALAGPAIAFTPHGLSFSEPATLTLPYSSASAALVVLRLDDEDDTTWEVTPSGSFAKGKATLKVSHFSIYAVAEESETPAGGGGAPPVGEGGAPPVSEGGAPPVGEGGAPSSAAGAPSGGGAGPVSGDVEFSCDRMDTGNGLHICSDYFYPANIVKLLGEDWGPACVGAGEGVLGEKCDTTEAVIGCLTKDVDGIPGVNVTNWFYMGTAEELMNGVLCDEEGTEFVNPP